MRFLHTADLHIGKRLNDVLMIKDQEYILKQIVDIAENNKVDAVIVAGDVYQKMAPTAEAMSIFDDFVCSLVESGIKAYIISGNHDSEQRVSYFSSIVKRSGVYVSERFDGKLQQYHEEDEYGSINISMLPYVKPMTVRRYLGQDDIETCQEAVQAVLNNSDINSAERNILICHQFLTGSLVCDSEERTVGGLDSIDASVFEDFDYVALGHIHRPQKVGRDTCRYAGSILKYSLSEEKHNKSVCIVDVLEKGSIDIHEVYLDPQHDVRTVTGMLSDILSMEPSDDYVAVFVEDENVPVDARIQVSCIFRNMLTFGVRNKKTMEGTEFILDEDFDDKSPKELFCDFYKSQNNGVEPSLQQLKIIDEILEELELTSDETD